MDTNSNQKDKTQVTSKDVSIGQKMSHEAVFLTVSKKAEKISTAIYMVTDLIESIDPIRQKMRSCSIDLIGQTRAMSSAFSGDIYFNIARTVNTSWELMSLIEVSSSVGFVSDMNANILKKVLIEFISSLRDKQRRESFAHIEDLKMGESLSDQITLSKKLFDVDEKETNISLPEKEIKDTSEFIKDNKMSFIKKEKVSNGQTNVKKINISTKKPTDSSPKKSERKEKIVEIVRQKGEVNISDIASSFEGVSSKTIQRELTSLVEANVLLRIGEKRWSKYSFV